MRAHCICLPTFLLLLAGPAEVKANSKCRFIPSTPNGKVTYSGDKTNIFINIDCNRGYKRTATDEKNKKSHKCTDGSWGENDIVPTCIYDRCPNIIGLQHGRMREFKPLRLAIFECDPGYAIPPEMKRRHTISCNKTLLQWSQPPSKCILHRCPHIKTFSHGEVTNNYSNLESRPVRFRCDKGYEPVSPDGNKPWSRCRRKENNDLAWQPALPTCQCKDPNSQECKDGAKQCPFIVGITNGKHRKKKGRGRDEGSEFEFSCELGYSLVGDSLVKCKDGKWSAFPSCLDNHCPHIENIAHGRISNKRIYHLGAELTLTCEKDYRPKGGKTLVCQENGSWSNPPLCIRNVCPYLLEFPNGRVTPMPFRNNIGGTVRYECDDGYEIEGVTSNKCKEDLTWESPHPKCVSNSS